MVFGELVTCGENVVRMKDMLMLEGEKTIRVVPLRGLVVRFQN
jgi:hypothetical protein